MAGLPASVLLAVGLGPASPTASAVFTGVRSTSFAAHGGQVAVLTVPQMPLLGSTGDKQRPRRLSLGLVPPAENARHCGARGVGRVCGPVCRSLPVPAVVKPLGSVAAPGAQASF